VGFKRTEPIGLKLMQDRIEGLLSFCSEFDFGPVDISAGAKEFCRQLDQEVISLCKSLPESTQTNALLFLMHCFRIALGQEFSIFTKYYPPAWSIVHWLTQNDSHSGKKETMDARDAKRAHSMALLLHPLDDHLNDGELAATHLALLLRSQSWLIMHDALNRLISRTDGGKDIVRSYLDNYYRGICGSEALDSLDSYCSHFRKQMATWLIVPFLAAQKKFSDTQTCDAVKAAYESFGIAWRLLDDINDIKSDMIQGSHSSIYCCLPEDIREYWARPKERRRRRTTPLLGIFWTTS